MKVAGAVLVLALSGPAAAETLADYGAHASCILAPNHVYKLSMPTQGSLARVAVERADKIKKGAIIAELESGLEQSQLDAARARAATDVVVKMKQAILGAAQAKVERQRTLEANHISSQQSLDEAVAAAAVARAEVEQATLDHVLAGYEVKRMEATLARRILRAPADGVVTAVDLHAGEYADPTAPVATLTEIDPLKANVYLPAGAFPLVAVGMKARIAPKDPAGPEREAVVITRDPQIDASSGLFLVELAMPNPDQSVPAGIRCAVEFAR